MFDHFEVDYEGDEQNEDLIRDPVFVERADLMMILDAAMKWAYFCPEEYRGELDAACGSIRKCMADDPLES